MVSEIRIVSIGPEQRLVGVTRELGSRGDGFVVYDRTHKVCLVAQSLAKTAAVIQRLVSAGILDAWMHVHSQGLYGASSDQIKSRTHKGWYAERVALCDLPERLAEVRTEGFAQVAIVTGGQGGSWEVR
jgi:hypothetical protein